MIFWLSMLMRLFAVMNTHRIIVQQVVSTKKKLVVLFLRLYPSSTRFQMIYKKTQLPCPLPFFYHNANLSVNGSDVPGLYALQNRSAHMDFSRADVSPAVLGSHDAHHSTGVHFEPHPDDEEMCTPKYFVFNSQVRSWSWWTNLWRWFENSFVKACLMKVGVWGRGIAFVCLGIGVGLCDHS